MGHPPRPAHNIRDVPGATKSSSSTAAKDRRKQQRGSAPVPPWYPRDKRSPQQAAHDTGTHDRWEQASVTAEPGQVESRPQPRHILLRTAIHAR